MKKIKVLVAGLALILVDFPIATQLAYPVSHIKNEASIRSFCVEVLKILMGQHFYIDILPDVLGYLLVIAALFMLRKYHKRFQTAGIAAIVGFVCSIASMFVMYLPFEVPDLLKAVAVIKAVDYFCIIVIMFSVGRGIYAQVDGYKYLEVWRDFKNCWDIMAIAPPFIYLLGLATIISFPMADELSMILYGLWLYGGILFLYYIYSYCKKINIFKEKQGL